MVCVQTIYRVSAVGIVKISESMHENLRLSSRALSRSMNAQAEHWLRVGMLAELNPNLRYGEICQLLIQDEQLPEDEIAVPAALSARAA